MSFISSWFSARCTPARRSSSRCCSPSYPTCSYGVRSHVSRSGGGRATQADDGHGAAALRGTASVRIALPYAEGLRVGNFTDAGTPFSDDAYRVENGVITADQTDPRRRMYEQNIIVHPSIIASVAAVDEENGTVLLWMNFGHT